MLLVDGGERQSPAEKALRRSGRFDVRRVHQAEVVLESREDLRSEKGLSGGGPSEGGPSEDDAQGPDLLVSSWFLPRRNGPGLTEELRAAGADVPILILTSREDAEARAKALRRGTGECLTRPPHPEELIARAVGLLRRPSKWQRVAWVQAGPLTVDTRRMEARLDDKDLGLRKKEFYLLYLLADRRPKVVRREMIATRVWGWARVSDNSIDVTTSALRDKLQGALSEEGSSMGSSTRDGSATGTPRPQIETVRGVGYRFTLGPTSET